jgi:AcrR family transcriptional regulator
MRPADAVGATVRERLLEALRELMTERDTVDVSIAEITARAGVNGALVSYYFGGREGLLVALARRDAEAAIVRIGRLMSADLNPIDKLRRHIAGVIRTYYERPYLNRLVNALLRDGSPAAAAAVASFFAAPVAEARCKILNCGRRQGMFRKVDPTLVSFAIDGACEHLFASRARLRLMFGVAKVDEALCRRHAAETSELLLRGLLAVSVPGPAMAARGQPRQASLASTATMWRKSQCRRRTLST